MFENIGDILSWIGDSPFRLFASLCVMLASVSYLFFKDHGPAYKLFIVVMLFSGVAGVGYSVTPRGSNADDFPTDNSASSLGLARVQDAIMETATDRRKSGCVESYAGVIQSIANSNQDDNSIQTANSIIQSLRDVHEFVGEEFGDWLDCQPRSMPRRGFTEKCQPAANAYFNVAPAILEGDLDTARSQLNLARSVFSSCRDS